MRYSLQRPLATTCHKPHNLLSGCASSECISSSWLLSIFALLLHVFGCCKHPPDAEFVVQCSVNAKEHLFQGIRDISIYGEFPKKSFQLLKRSSAQEKTNRVAANGSAVKPQPVRRGNLQIPALESCIDG